MDLKKLKEQRTKLLGEVEALRAPSGGFANDENRRSFDEKMAQIEALDEQIRDLETDERRRTPQSVVVPGSQDAPRQPIGLVEEEPNDHDRGRAAEKIRSKGIREACTAARMSRAFEDDLLASDLTLEQCQGRVFEELRRRGYDGDGPRQGGQVRTNAPAEDTSLLVARGIKDALLHRVAPHFFPLTDAGRDYRGMSMMDVAKEYLRARGISIRELGRNEIVSLALQGRGVGLHTTSDFPLLLADVASKSLRRAYEEAPQTWRPLARQVNLPDFRTKNMVQLGDAPELLELTDDHAEYTSGTIGEGREQYALATYGRKFGITRKAMINDDLDAFSRVPQLFGRKARAKESDLVYAQITTNPTMGDGNALFSIAHNNIATTDGAIDVASLGAGRAKIRLQTSINGEYLNLSAAYLIVPPGMQTLAEQYVTLVQAVVNSAVNPFAGKLTVITDPRLTNEDEWYLAASPNEIEWLVFGYLEGEEGPQMESRNGFDIDGIEFKCRLEFAAKVMDWRGIYRNEGPTA